MNRLLDAECEIRLGAKTDSVYSYDIDPEGNRVADGEIYDNVRHFSSDITAAKFLEDEIARRGLQSRYINALLSNIPHYAAHIEHYSSPLHPPMTLWAVLRATPEQRARAFLAATEGL